MHQDLSLPMVREQIVISTKEAGTLLLNVPPERQNQVIEGCVARNKMLVNSVFDELALEMFGDQIMNQKTIVHAHRVVALLASSEITGFSNDAHSLKNVFSKINNRIEYNNETGANTKKRQLKDKFKRANEELTMKKQQGERFTEIAEFLYPYFHNSNDGYIELLYTAIRQVIEEYRSLHIQQEEEITRQRLFNTKHRYAAIEEELYS